MSAFDKNDNPDIKFYYSNKNVRTISNKITELLMGVQMSAAPTTETPKAAPGGVKFLGFEKS
jgi:hypothetical protein